MYILCSTKSVSIKTLYTCSLLLSTVFTYASKSSRHHSTSTAIMKGFRNDGIGGRGMTYLPSNGEYKNVLVFMHGLGDTADGWASMMPGLGLENTKFVLPTATNRPIAINGNMPMPGKVIPFFTKNTHLPSQII